MKSLIYGVVIGVTLIGAAQSKAELSNNFVGRIGMGFTAAYMDVGKSPVDGPTDIKYEDWFAPDPLVYAGFYAGHPRLSLQFGLAIGGGEGDISQWETTLRSATQFKGGLMTFRAGKIRASTSGTNKILDTKGWMLGIGLENPKNLFIELGYHKYHKSRYKGVTYDINEEAISLRLVYWFLPKDKK